MLRLTTKIILPALAAILAAAACSQSPPARKVFILGVDGLDPLLLQKFVEEGALPNFERFMREGGYSPLQTSMPPLSPVAWSTFITGMDAGGHAIFDFVHRDPKTMIPEFSMAEAIPSEWNLSIGSWVIPLSGGRVEQLRKGRPFWQILEERGIPTTLFRMPVNFPPSPPGRALSGMGTPDILGTPGTFAFYTDTPPANADDISGGRVFEVQVKRNVVEAKLVGPANTFRRVEKEPSAFAALGGGDVEYVNPKMEIDFKVFLDPEEAVAKLVVQDDEFILKEGEWSNWLRLDFEAVPQVVSVSAVARFYLQQVHPDFRLYVTPFQINPEDPVMPISTPEDWAPELQSELGFFYTQELPEDTKAFSGGIFDGNEFWEQSQFVYREQRKALDHLLENFTEGLLFFYFSSVDQSSHMLWHYMDPEHPEFETSAELAGSLRTVYQEVDEALGRILESVDEDTTLIVMSDHGFGPFYWGVNLNSWLLDNGYVKLRNPAERGRYPVFLNVDWSGTRAYAVGLNGLYVNLRGREREGIVEPGGEYQQLLDQLEADLLAMKDPRNGKNPITLVIQTRRDLKGRNLELGPDMIVGYNWGYRSSWSSPLGEFPRGIFVDNDNPWSGDHGNDYRLVPGVLLSNRKITLDQPALYDLTVAVLDEYGVAKLPEMIGRDCLGDPE